MKYRILKVEEYDETYYLLQTKFLFWWRTEKCIFGRCNYSDIRKFKSIEDVKEYYQAIYKKPNITIIEEP